LRLPLVNNIAFVVFDFDVLHFTNVILLYSRKYTLTIIYNVEHKDSAENFQKIFSPFDLKF